MYFSNWGGLDPVGNVVKNNIFYDNKNGSVTYDGSFDPPVIESNWEENGVDPGFVDLSGADPDNPDLPDLHLDRTSPAKDQGAWLTTITSESGSGDSFTVADANYFMDGWTIIEGDLIQLEGQTQAARITDVDYEARTITVGTSLTFTEGQGVGMAYADTARDQGAFEIGEIPAPIDGGPSAGDSGPADVDGGAGAGADAGTGGADAGTGGADRAGGEEGCSCRSAGGEAGPLVVVAVLVLALLAGLGWSRGRARADATRKGLTRSPESSPR
jgi:hypothetical protein